MGRKSALTPEQWAEIDRRILLEGESAYKLAKEFGVNESTIRRKIKPSCADKAESAVTHPEIRAIALRKANADDESERVARRIAQLPVATQRVVTSLAARLSTISGHLASAAEYGAATAHRLTALANAEVSKVDDADPLSGDSMDAMRGVAALTKLANDSASIAINLLAANKDTVKALNAEEPRARTIDPAKLSSQALEELLKARG